MINTKNTSHATFMTPTKTWEPSINVRISFCAIENNFTDCKFAYYKQVLEYLCFHELPAGKVYIKYFISHKTMPKFNVSAIEFYLKHCMEKKKPLITCDFSLSHIVFYPICELLTFTNFVVSINFQEFNIRSFVIYRLKPFLH